MEGWKGWKGGKDGRVERMEGWKGWKDGKDGRMEGWKDGKDGRVVARDGLCFKSRAIRDRSHIVGRRFERRTVNEDDCVPNSKTLNPKLQTPKGIHHRGAERRSRNQSSSSCSSSCSCSKRGGINWTGFVCPFRSACFVGRRSCGDALRATIPRPAMGRASLPASQLSSRSTVAQRERLD